MTSKNLFAWASISENGTINGTKGDQTGKELKVGNYYNFGQTKLIRFTNESARKEIGVIAKTMCKSNFCGYSQEDRYSLFNVCRKYKWSWPKIKAAIKDGTISKCNCDCSSLASTVINVAYGRQVVPCCTTATIGSNVVKRGIGHIYSIEKVKSFKKGDMPYKEHKHIIINV